MNPVLTLTASDWLGMFQHFASLSLLAVGGAITTAPDMLTMSHNQPARDWPLYALTLLTTLVVWRTKVHMLWLIGAGALLGALGWV